MIKKLILPFLLFLSSCSSEPQTKDRIFADLYVRYSQPLKETKAEARFSTGIDRENAKSMKINNGVIFQKKDMTMKEVPNKKTWWYVLTEKRDFSNTFTFSFPSSKHLKSDIEININALDELTIQGDFSKSKGVQFSWKGSPLSENESIAFLFKDEKKLSSFKINGPTNSSSINIPSEKLKTLPEGEGEIYLVRKQSNITEQSNVTILSKMEYYSRVISVTILP